MSEKINQLLAGKGENYIFPFFWVRGESEEVLREYMNVIHDSNIGAVCVESRPHPDFCGDKWWQDMDVIMDEAQKLGMQVWILDDSHFPTGFANGAIENKPVELRRQSICCRIKEASGQVIISPEELAHPDPFEKTQMENFVLQGEMATFDDDKLLAVYAIRVDRDKNGFADSQYRVDLSKLVTDQGISWQTPEGSWKIYTMHLSRNFGYHRSYINMMNEESCRVLIDTVYEPHFKHYGHLFGTTIAGFFSDEPEVGNGHIYESEDKFGTMIDFPWSGELQESLTESMGLENFYKLALLWENDADPDLIATARYTYMDAVTRLIQKDFSQQIGSWCQEHGVKYIGHLIEDNDHHSRLGSSLGHYFRGLRGQHMAGIDDIGGQVLPQQEDVCYNRGMFQNRDGHFFHYVMGKLASSAAAIEPHKEGNSMCEIFGAYGWSEGVQLEKYLADHFMVRGVNHFVPHAFSAAEFPDPDCPPHFYAHGHNPQYRHFGALMKYMNRVCALISGGRRVVNTALLYDGEADWTTESERSGRTAQILLDRQADFDIVPQDVFAERDFYKTKVANGVLKVNTQSYTRFIVTPTKYITCAFARAVKEMTKAGVKVYFIDQKPVGVCDGALGEPLSDLLAGAEIISYDGLAAMAGNELSDIAKLSPASNRVRSLHYEHTDGSGIIYFVNEAAEPYQGKVTLQGVDGRKVVGYDAWNNCLYPVDIRDGQIQLSIDPSKGIIFLLDNNIEETQLCQTPEQKTSSGEYKAIDLTDGFTRSLCQSIEYPAFGQAKEVCLPDSLAEDEPRFSGIARYEKVINIADPAHAILEITDAAEGVEVFVNGISCGIQVVPGYIYDLSQVAIAGENTLAIEVATTLERGTYTGTNMFGAPEPEPTCKSGITGIVKIYERA